MRMIILSALMGLGIGLAGIPAANAAPISGLSSTAIEGSLLQDVQYYRRAAVSAARTAVRSFAAAVRMAAAATSSASAAALVIGRASETSTGPAKAGPVLFGARLPAGRATSGASTMPTRHT